MRCELCENTKCFDIPYGKLKIQKLPRAVENDIQMFKCRKGIKDCPVRQEIIDDLVDRLEGYEEDRFIREMSKDHDDFDLEL